MINANKLVEVIKENTDLEVSINEVQKGNVILTGITIGNGTIRPTLYTRNYEDLYDKYGYEAVATKMLEDAKNAELDVNPIELASYTSWEYAKEHLKLCIAPNRTNNDVVTYPYLDLELYIRVIVKNVNNGTASYKVQNYMLEEWNVTTEQLLHAALDCTKPTYTVQSMSKVLFGFEMEDDPMLIIRTEDEMHGASAIYCKDILKQISNKYDSDLVVIPSNIHEILVIPMAMQMELDDISRMVHEINETEVSPEEVLSDHAYIFNKNTNKITW